MENLFTFYDAIVLALYFAATLGLGAMAIRKASNIEGYTSAGGVLPGWLTGLSILGSFVSSISFLALPGKAFASNWNAFVWGLSLPFATYIAAVYFVPFYRSLGNVSAYAHLETRFGAWARIYAGICYLLTQLVRMGAVTYLMALPMNVLLGWNIFAVIIATGLIVTIYTLFGGIVAVIWTEAIQTVVLIAGAIGCLILMFYSMPDGPMQIFDIAISHDKFSLGSFSITDFTTSTVWVLLIYGLFINLQNFGIDQNYVQRYISTKSLREARKSLWISGLTYLPLTLIFFLIGTSLFSFYTAYPDLLPNEYINKPDYVFPYFIVISLPTGVRGLLIAAIFAAAMSTISCSLNSSATIIFSDYYKRYFNAEATEKQAMRFIKIATSIWGILGTLIALGFTAAYNALDAWWILAGIFSGGMLGLFLLELVFKEKSNSSAAAIAVILGISLIAYLTLSPYCSFLPDLGFSPLLIPVFGTSLIFVSGFILTKFFSSKL